MVQIGNEEVVTTTRQTFPQGTEPNPDAREKNRIFITWEKGFSTHEESWYQLREESLYDIGRGKDYNARDGGKSPEGGFRNGDLAKRRRNFISKEDMAEKK